MTVRVRLGPFPPEPLAAAAHFHSHELPRIEAVLGDAEVAVLVFPPADHAHRAWRLAAVQALARRHAPGRVNAVESGDEAAIAAGERLLGSNAGITGQLLALDGVGAGSPLSLPA